jgi:hypothetical protein
MISLADEALAAKMGQYMSGFGNAVEKANQALAEIKYTYKTN